MVTYRSVFRTGVAAGRPAGAVFSEDGKYRYELWRKLPGLPADRSLTFIMLNPSDADHEHDDATVRRCVGFAARERCGLLIALNLFALVARDPRELRNSDDPVGPLNNGQISATIGSRRRFGNTVVAAWGAGAPDPPASQRIGDVLAMLGRMSIDLHALGDLTVGGHPRHPLYLPADAPLRVVTGLLRSGEEQSHGPR